MCFCVICAVSYVLWAYAHSCGDQKRKLNVFFHMPLSLLPWEASLTESEVHHSVSPAVRGALRIHLSLPQYWSQSQVWRIKPGFLFTLSAGEASSGPHTYIASASTCWDAFSLQCYNSYLKILKPHPLVWRRITDRWTMLDPNKFKQSLLLN